MSVGRKYRKKPLEVEAVRYGKDEDGSWYSGSVQRVAQFILGYEFDHLLSDVEILDVLKPAGLWEENGDLEMWDGVAHRRWLPLAPGDWVIKGVNGEFYPCKPDIFESTYEPVEEEGE